MLVINFSHPLVHEHVKQIEELTQQTVDKIINIRVQLDLEQPLGEQIANLADQVGLTSEQWQTEQIIVNLPGLAPAAALMLAELHGRMGYFPPFLRFKQVNEISPRYVICEIANPAQQRDRARHRR